ncbi:hypothetical protein RW1_056_00260 [Rhodococcus wratislaviensis NBRC 100605]|uniref:Uncharacterized protein n=1 Tax=Rhodococcus wratislaviensis NBRC 100605 TaxID=1219028 RepID=X0PYM5_RHOWR|nr:hypothetical protein RW1_056_00260 [Rhodococcus wratislaviensis NBRC 100605]
MTYGCDSFRPLGARQPSGSPTMPVPVAWTGALQLAGTRGVVLTGSADGYQR